MSEMRLVGSNASGASADPVGELMPTVLNLYWFPLVLIQLSEGKAARPFLADVFGLSQSRLRPNRAQQWRPSTLRKAVAASEAWRVKRAISADWTVDEIEADGRSAPSALAGEPRPFANFVHGLEGVDKKSPLPLTKAFAEDVDRLLGQLAASYEARDLDSFKKLILECDWGGPASPDAIDASDAIRHAADWSTLTKASSGIADEILVCFLAALDVEHGATYFQRFRQRPLFPLVLPRVNPSVDLSAATVTIPKRNFIRRPARRLLELMYAMAFYVRHRRWPAKPVSRRNLAQAIDLDERHVGNLYDGTRRLTWRLYETISQRLFFSVGRKGPFNLPTPLFIAALLWGEALIATDAKGKVKRVVVLDERNYLRYWQWHRARWASQLPQGTEGWPDWLDN